MRATPVNLIGGFYADESRHWSVQDTCNWLPVVAERAGTLTPAKLATPPGLRPYQQIGTGPIRGMHDCEGHRFVVSGRTLYRITNTGVGIPLGTIPGVGRVSISHNQFKGGNQVLVCNGAPGGGYVYDTRAQTFERITDPGFPGSLQTAYIDSYLLGVDPAGRFWFHSNLADATDYNTMDRYEAEAAPDRIVGLAVSQFEVIVFGERTAEFYGNAGGATGTFQSKRAVIDRGCASRHTICNLDNSVFWLGDDGIVYRLEGYAARRVSTVPLERALAGLRWSDAFAFAWEDKGHKVYYLTFPDGQTWGYDVVCGLWHRRESYGLSRWRLNDAVRWGSNWYGGDFQNGRIWQLDWDYPAEGDQPMVSERTSPVMADNQSAFIASSVELIMGVGQQSVVITGVFPEQPPMPVISGNAPNTFIGADYSFTYSTSSGTAPLKFSLIGELPSGLSLDELTGVISGTAVAADQKSFVVRVTDKNGLWAEVADSISVGAAIWLLRTTGATDSRLWVSGDGMDWAGPYVRAPFVVAAGRASHQLYDGSVVVVGGSDKGELVIDKRVGDGVLTESIDVPAGIGRIRTIGNVTAAFYGANNAQANSYWLLSGGSRIWEEVTLPAGRRVRDIARDGDGRWWCYQQLNADYAMYYSDEEVPRTWIASGYSEPTNGDEAMAAGDGMVMAIATLNRVMRRKESTWQTLTPSGPAGFPDSRAAIYSSGRWIFAGQPTAGDVNLIYSDDDGASFTGVTVPGINSIENIYSANGRLIASGNTIVSATGRATVCVSDDNGTTWVPTNHPYAVESGGSAVAFPVT